MMRISIASCGALLLLAQAAVYIGVITLITRGNPDLLNAHLALLGRAMSVAGCATVLGSLALEAVTAVVRRRARSSVA